MRKVFKEDFKELTEAEWWKETYQICIQGLAGWVTNKMLTLLESEPTCKLLGRGPAAPDFELVQVQAVHCDVHYLMDRQTLTCRDQSDPHHMFFLQRRTQRK